MNENKEVEKKPLPPLMIGIAICAVLAIGFCLKYSSSSSPISTATTVAAPVPTPTNAPKQTKLETQEKVIPGLSVENIYSVLSAAGFDELKNDGKLFELIDDKNNGEYMQVSISSPDGSDGVSSVEFTMWSEPNISPTIGGILPSNPTINNFFPKVASVSYSDADPMKAYTWAMDQFNNGTPQTMPVETVIGSARYTFNIQYFKELIYSLKISVNDATTK